MVFLFFGYEEKITVSIIASRDTSQISSSLKHFQL